MRYAFACDRREFDVQASCFVPDVGGTWGFGEIPDRDTMMDYIHQVARFHTTMHFMGNEFIEVDGNEASLQAYSMLMHRATRRDGTPFQYNPSDRRYSEAARTPRGPLESSWSATPSRCGRQPASAPSRRASPPCSGCSTAPRSTT